MLSMKTDEQDEVEVRRDNESDKVEKGFTSYTRPLESRGMYRIISTDQQSPARFITPVTVRKRVQIASPQAAHLHTNTAKRVSKAPIVSCGTIYRMDLIG